MVANKIMKKKTKRIFSRKQHKGREDLAGEYKWGDAGQIILFFVFFSLLLADDLIFHWQGFLGISVSFWIRVIISAPVFFIAGYLARQGLRIVFKEERGQMKVINKGVFGIVRHPIYLGSILFYFGSVVISFSFVCFLIWIIIVLFYCYIAKYEEKILIEKIGPEYLNYMKKTGFLIPKIKKQGT